MTPFTRFAALSVLTTLFGVACSGADAVPVDQSAPAQSSAALVGPPAAPQNGMRHERFFERLDRNGDGKVELSEVPERMRPWLTEADTNHDGVLTREELEAHKPPHDGPRGDMMAKLDTNNDGKIEVSELPARAQERLAGADSNNDGVLSREEFIAFRKQRGVERFKKADTNNDGALTQAEVGDKKWSFLSKADANGDGKVTFAEIEQAFKDHKLGRMGHMHHDDDQDAQ